VFVGDEHAGDRLYGRQAEEESVVGRGQRRIGQELLEELLKVRVHDI